MKDHDDGTSLSTQAVLEIVHALSEGVNAVRKTVQRELSFEDRLKTSVYELLEAKLETQALTYYDCAKLLEVLFREFEYFDVLIQNLIGFCSAGQTLTLERSTINLKRLLEEVVALFEASAAEKGLSIELVVVGEPSLKLDRQLVRRALINLMDNAVKYSYVSIEGERFIEIRCHRYSSVDDWVVSFESFGVGITKEEITSGAIFKYGTRGILSGDRGRKGTGIGLAETKRIVDAHGGKLLVSSNKKGEDAYLTSIKLVFPSWGGHMKDARH